MRWGPGSRWGRTGEGRKKHKERNCKRLKTHYPGKAGPHPKVGFPEKTGACPPQMTRVPLGFNSGELRECVVHVKGLVVQNFLKYIPRRRIVLHYIAINSEAAGSCLLR